MAKKPAKKPAAKRGGAKKPAPQGGKAKAKTPRGQVERHGKAKAAEREWGRKPDARAQDSALPHYDPTDVAFEENDPPRHPTVEEQYRAEHADAAAPRAKRPGPWTRFRSAVTGLFVSMGFAKRNPGTTVGEKVES